MTTFFVQKPRTGREWDIREDPKPRCVAERSLPFLRLEGKSMKKVIDGKLYDTKTAELLHEWSAGFPTSDFHHCYEALYRTPRGALFLHGEGGPLTKYATSHGNSRGSGEDITPMTREEAMAWLEQHDGVAALIEHFSDSIEDA